MKKSMVYRTAKGCLLGVVALGFVAMADSVIELMTYKNMIVTGMIFVPLYVYLDRKGVEYEILEGGNHE